MFDLYNTLESYNIIGGELEPSYEGMVSAIDKINKAKMGNEYMLDLYIFHMGPERFKSITSNDLNETTLNEKLFTEFYKIQAREKGKEITNSNPNFKSKIKYFKVKGISFSAVTFKSDLGTTKFYVYKLDNQLRFMSKDEMYNIINTLRSKHYRERVR